MKKIISVVLVIVLLLATMSLLSINVLAATSGITGDCTWKLENGVMTISGKGPMDDYRYFYDAALSGYKPTPWHEIKDNITKVIIEEGVTSVGNYAFESCTNLETVSLPDSLIAIGRFSFDSCSKIKEITIPEKVQKIGEYAFEDTDEVMLNFNAIDCDARYAFSNSGIRMVAIGEKVKKLSDFLFDDAKNLEIITGGENVKEIGVYAFSGTAFYNNDKNWQEGVLYACNWAVASDESISGICQIKDGTIGITPQAFMWRYDLTSVIFPNSVLYIGNNAFADCSSLNNVVFSENLEYIGERAFSSCDLTGAVNIPESLEFIGEEAFEGNKITEFIVYEDNKKYCSIDGILFNKDKTILMKYPEMKTDKIYSVPESVILISSSAFAVNEFLEKITLNDGIREIGDAAFFSCSSLKKINIPDSVEKYSKILIGCDSLESIEIGNGIYFELMDLSYESLNEIIIDSDNDIYTVEDGVIFSKDKSVLIFADRNIVNYIIPSEVKYICDQAFYNCGLLEAVTITNSVTSIGENAFANCKSLNNIILPDSAFAIGSYAFKNTAYYNNEENWENEVLYIDKHLICSNDSLSGEYNVRPGTISIADFAFERCWGLNNVTIPNSVKKIGRYAFVDTAYYCDDSNWVDGGLYIGNYLISVATDFNVTFINYKINQGTTVIADYAFTNGNSSKITIPASVTEIGSSLSGSSIDLEYINVDENNSKYCDIDGVLFNKEKTEIILYPAQYRDASSLTSKSYTIPDSVKTIGKSAFDMCFLECIAISENVTYIEEYAFDDYLSTIYYGGSEEQWNELLANIPKEGNEILFEVEVIFNADGLPVEAEPGDLDGDGEVSTTDLAVIKLFLAGTGKLDETGLLAGDLNDDGEVNTTDLASLKLMLAGIES